MGNTVAEDTNKEQQQGDVQPENMTAEVAPQKKSYLGIILGVINLILILLIVGAGFYFFKEVKDGHQAQGEVISKGGMREIELSKQLNSYQTQLSSMQSQITNFDSEITGKDNHFTQTLADFSALHSERLDTTRKGLEAEVTLLKRQLGKTRGDWLVADAEYLLSIANQRLLLVGDVHTTRMALDAADQRLRESGDSAVYKVREQITKEIAGLRSITLPDVVGMHALIQLLRDKVSHLAVLLPYAGKPLTKSKQIHDHEQSPDAEHGILGSALGLLEGYVTVKHSDQPVSKILTEEEVGFIRQQLNVKLEIIKVALVQQSDALFKVGITDAKEWVASNFTKNESSKGFLAELEKLNSVTLRSEFPDISQSLKMLKDISKLRLEADRGQASPNDESSTEEAIIAPVLP